MEREPMFKGGFSGRILRINLTEKSSRVERLPYETARDYIGGAGFGVRYLFDQVKAGTDALGTGNKLIFSVGPFTGSSIPCASRMAVTAKSPLTNAVGVCLTGGDFPAELKFAGYDALIIEGRARRPTYVSIRDDQVRFHSAEKLWGTKTTDFQQIVKNSLKDEHARIACIGPAGEHMSKIACIINEMRAAGRKGLGAVMGSKQLKGIAVRGSGSVGVSSPQALKKAVADMKRAMKQSPSLYSRLSNNGTSGAVDLTCGLGIFPARNWKATGEFTPADRIGSAAQMSRKIGATRCYGCPVGCAQLRLARSGEYAGILAEGPEFETLYSLGGQTGVDNPDSIIAADRLCDELGLDTMSAGVTIGFAMELFERGILTATDTGGLDLTFGNHRSMISLLRLMAFREGIGDLLADGVRAAAEKLGEGTDQYAMHVKGLELPGYDVRGAKAHGLNYATSYNGADHNRGYAFQEIQGLPIPYAVDRFAAEGKGSLTKLNQDMVTAACDCPTMCSFLLIMAFPGNAPENTSALMQAISGISYTPEEILKVGERVVNLARAFNVREGFTRKDDTFPRRLMEEPLSTGASKGHLIRKEDLELMLNEYYTARGWDVSTGIPTRKKLTELGLEEAADVLGL